MSGGREPRDVVRFATALIATASLVLLKVLGAWAGHSLALGADAAHSLGDVGALGLAWYADRQRNRPPTDVLTFGWGRVEILVGLLNALVLWALAGALGWAAVRQWSHPTAANAEIMALAAGVALVVNGVLAWNFRESEDLNRRSTWWHLMTDAAGSLGVLVGASILAATGWRPINAVVTLAIVLLMIWGPWSIIRDTFRILLEATPAKVPLADIAAKMQAVPGVARVHDLHVWAVGSQQWALACHIELAASPPSAQTVLCDLHDCLAGFGFDHTTIQLETSAEAHPEPGW